MRPQVKGEKYRAYLAENKRRRAEMFAPYDPIRGVGSPLERVRVAYSVGKAQHEVFYTLEMYEKEAAVRSLAQHGSVEKVLQESGIPVTKESIEQFLGGLTEKRFDYDFEFWAIVASKIQDKESKTDIPFRLNRPQRKLLQALEKMRQAGVPIRVIIDKARQWGGSTLVQLYMAWVQIRHKENWHSAIVADVEEQVRNIRSMFNRMAKLYPPGLGTVTLVNFEGSAKNKLIKERGGIIGMGSAQKPDNLRSFDFAMLHLSEAGLWKTTQGKSPEDLAQSLRATVPSIPYSMIVLESTAKGVGNFFHREWLKAIKRESGYEPVFVAWWGIERYQKTPKSMRKLVNFVEKDAYAQFLWKLGATLEGIEWYFWYKKSENYDDWRMGSEFPSTWQESFQSTGQRVYPPGYVQKARSTCCDPEWIGDITAEAQTGKKAFEKIDFFEDPKGRLSVWDMPDHSVKISNRYTVTVDIGGTTAKADHSIIKVHDRYWMMDGGKPEVVAVWEGHLDQDLVSWKAAQIGWWYNKGLVTVEVNSLKKEENTEGTHYLTVLDEIVDFYPNLYMRTDPQKVREGLPAQYGFHTNAATKSMVINRHKAACRDEEIIEKDIRACDEMDTYEVKPNGSLGAVEGCRDDHVITSAIGTWICLNYLPLPKEVKPTSERTHKRIVNEASI